MQKTAHLHRSPEIEEHPYNQRKHTRRIISLSSRSNMAAASCHENSTKLLHASSSSSSSSSKSLQLHDDEMHHQLQDQDHFTVHGSFSAPSKQEDDDADDNGEAAVMKVEKEMASSLLPQKDMSNGRERLKRHRQEVAGRVMIPDSWGQESLLKEWMDYSSFDKLLAPSGIASAREALVAEGRRTTSHQRLRIESRCC